MIFVEKIPNPHIVYFHVRRRLTNAALLMFSSKDWEIVEIADMGLLRSLASILFGEGRKLMKHEHAEMMRNKKLIDALFDINGVVNITLTQFSIGIEKGHVFDWSNLQPSILKVLERNNLDT